MIITYKIFFFLAYLWQSTNGILCLIIAFIKGDLEIWRAEFDEESRAE